MSSRKPLIMNPQIRLTTATTTTTTKRKRKRNRTRRKDDNHNHCSHIQIQNVSNRHNSLYPSWLTTTSYQMNCGVPYEPHFMTLQHRLSICRIAASFTIDPNDLFEPGRVEKTGGSVRKVNETAFKSWTETLSEQESWKKHCKHPSEQFRVPSNNSHLSLLCSPFGHKFCCLFERDPLLPLEQKPSPLGLSTNLLQKALQSLGSFRSDENSADGPGTGHFVLMVILLMVQKSGSPVDMGNMPLVTTGLF